jgi:hypothetical protein
MRDTGESTFASNPAIDAAIKEMLPYLSIESQGRVRKAILDAKRAVEKYRDENADAGARHIFRELIPAAFLNKQGFSFEYAQAIQGRTPDWFDATSGLLLESYTFERGGSSRYIDRITSAVSSKCAKYNDIIAEKSLRFIVAVYLDFLTGMTLDDCNEDSESFRPIFDANDLLWAILFFTETQVEGQLIDGKLHKTQHYGFFCLCVDSTFEAIPNWPFETVNVRQ